MGRKRVGRKTLYDPLHPAHLSTGNKTHRKSKVNTGNPYPGTLGSRCSTYH